MKITDVSSVTPVTYYGMTIIDCIHKHIKDGIGNRYEIFVLNKENKMVAHFESNKVINVSGLDIINKCENLFALERCKNENEKLERKDDESEMPIQYEENRYIELYRIEKDNTCTFLNLYEDMDEESSEGYFAVKRDGLWGFINTTNGEEVIKPQYESVEGFQDSFAMVKKDGKHGVIDKQNNVIIPIKYRHSMNFCDGYISMNTKSFGTDVYNEKGELVYSFECGREIHNLGYGLFLMETAKHSNKFEIVEASTGIKTPVEFKDLEVVHPRISGFSNYAVINCHHEEFTMNKPTTHLHETYFLNKNLEVFAKFQSKEPYSLEQINPDYDNLFAMSEDDFIALIKIEEDGTHTVINRYESIEFGIEDGTFAVKKNGLWGFIDGFGNEIIAPQYERYWCFCDGFAMVKNNGMRGIIDKHNNKVVPIKYQSLKRFEGGYTVGINDSGADVYNANGEIVQQFPKKKKVYNLGNGSLLVRNDHKEYEIIEISKKV